MDIEAVKQFLATDEGKALIENSEAISGLRTKKDELLSKNVQMKTQLEAYSALGDVETLSKAVSAFKQTGEKKDDVTVDPKLAAQLEHLNNTEQLNEVNNENLWYYQ